MHIALHTHDAHRVACELRPRDAAHFVYVEGVFLAVGHFLGNHYVERLRVKRRRHEHKIEKADVVCEDKRRLIYFPVAHDLKRKQRLCRDL